MVTPSIGVRETAEHMKPFLGADVPVVILSKGVEGGSNLLMTEVLTDVLGNKQRIAGLSGPNHAEEVSKGIPVGHRGRCVRAQRGRAVPRHLHDAVLPRLHQP